jgi:signal peptidase I
MSSGLTFEKHRHSTEIKSKIHPNLRNELLEYLFYFLRVFLVVTFVFVFLKTNVYQVTSVEGRSMYPNYENADILFIDLFTPKFGDYRRGDVVIVQPPKDFSNGNKNFIKRVIGLPGDTVGLEKGKVFIVNTDYSLGVNLNEKSYLNQDIQTYPQNGTADRFQYPKLGPDEYFVMGDNRGGSSDSRVFGKITKDHIIGREFYRSSPSDKVGAFTLPKYNINN